MYTYSALFIVALLVSFVVTPIVRNIAIRRGLVDQPDERRIHTSPIPRIGGVAIFLAFIISVGLVSLLHTDVSHLFKSDLSSLLSLVGPSCLIFLVGILDDVWGTRPSVKIGAQIVAGILLYMSGTRIEFIKTPFVGELSFNYLALPVTVLWVVAISNAFNLIDGIDGLSAGSALFATLTLGVAALVNGHPPIVFLSIALAGSILGFLKYNFNPATVFMGDSGSLFIGFVLAALSIQSAQKSATVVAIAIPIVSFGLPILETVLSMARRFLSGKPIFSADREHIHHVLLARGWSMRQVVVVLYAVSAGFSLFALLFLSPSNGLLGLVLFVLGVSVWIGIQHLGYHEFDEMGRIMQRGANQRQIIANNIKIRRIAAGLAAANTLGEVWALMESFLDMGEFSNAEIVLLSAGFGDKLAYAQPRMFRKNEQIRWEWPRDEKSTLADPSRFWLIRLPLSSFDRVPLGEVMLYRELTAPQLNLDINLVHGYLFTELNQALERIVGPEKVKSAGTA